MPAPMINNVPFQAFTDAGAVAASHKLYTYAAGTTNDQATYSDAGLTTVNANPIILDSAGRATIFLNPALGLYKFVLKNSDDSATLWTRDDVGAFQESIAPFIITGTAGETMSLVGGETFPLMVYLSDGSGGKTAGRWYIADEANDYSSSKAIAVGIFEGDAVAAGDDFPIRVQGRVTGYSGLTAGNTVAIGSLGQAAGTSSTRRNILLADSTTSGILLPVESADQTTGPLPAINGHALSGLTKTEVFTSTSVGNAAGVETALYDTDGTKIYDPVTATAGDCLVGHFWGVTSATANVKTLSLRVRDDDAIVGPNNTVALTGTIGGGFIVDWGVEFCIVRTAATTFQSHARYVATAGAGNAPHRVSNLTAQTVAWDGTTGDIYIQVTGNAAADDDITLKGGYISSYTQG